MLCLGADRAEQRQHTEETEREGGDTERGGTERGYRERVQREGGQRGGGTDRGGTERGVWVIGERTTVVGEEESRKTREKGVWKTEREIKRKMVVRKRDE